MAIQHWLVKSEPDTYSWTRFVKEKRAVWDGVRNFEARNNLRAMNEGDLVLYYHSGEERAIVGVARVVKTAYPDPTATDGDWSVVDLVPVKALERPVTLAELKADAALEDMPLIKRSRLSVLPESAAQFQRVLKMSGTKL